jgi:hypothetical protein
MYFTKPHKTKPKSQMWRTGGGQERVPLFLLNDQETPCPERHEHDGRIEVVHHLTGKLLP